MKKIFSFLLLISFSLLATAKDGKNNTAKASLTAVTVYRSGAEMNHIARADLKPGNNELLIDNLSNVLDVNSVQINCNGNVTVMGVEFSTDHLLNETKSALVKMLEDSAENINGNLEKIRTGISITEELLTVLKANKEIKGSQTGLSVAELMKLMEYYRVKSIELRNELAAFKLKEKKQNELLQKINEQIAEEENKNTQTSGRLILQLNCAVAGKYDFTVSYVTPNAYWTPFYDLRADNINSPLKLVYRAKIYQTTGIDWQQVKLSLSTSSPGQTGNAPLLSTWFLSYINPVYYYNQSLAKMNTIQSMKVAEDKDENVVTGYQMRLRGGASLTSDTGPLYIVNGAEMSYSEFSKIDSKAIKSMDVLKDASSIAMYGARGSNGIIIITLKEGMNDYVSVSDKELNVIFDIDLPYDVPTNGKAQTAVLKEYQVPAFYKFYSVPKLDKDVFLLAEIPDWEKLNLLPGEANIIFEGTYIGKSFIDPSSTQDTLNFTMGRDKKIVVKREKLMDYSSVKFFGSNKKQIFTYELTVKNNKKDAIDILVKDQYPISKNKEVEVELLQSDGATINEETGVVTWKLKMAAGEVKKLRISYSVKYPKDKQLNLN